MKHTGEANPGNACISAVAQKRSDESRRLVCMLAGLGKGGDTSLTATSLCKKKMLFPIETFVESETVWVCCVFVCECLSKSLLNLLQVVTEKKVRTHDISIDNDCTVKSCSMQILYSIVLS